MAVKIASVQQNSKAAHHGIKAGDSLVSINAHSIFDVLDYRFHVNARRLALSLVTLAGKKRIVVLSKKDDEDIGLEFETYLMDKQQHCKNKCIFCFIDQMPEGMRESLYFKDDDSRLSFLFGNYITLTGLCEREIERIMQMHISPVNVSVHTMNPELRVEMMKNKHAGEALNILKRFADAGISLNTQLVLCPGINDGAELEFSLNELAKLYPAVQSIAAVPVGLTKHREGLPELHGYTKQQAQQVLDTVNTFGDAFLKKYGTRLAYAADEFYLKAGVEIPDEDYYEDFAQLENGVGMWALMKSEFNAAMDCIDGTVAARKVDVATGVAAYPLINQLCDCVNRRYPQLEIKVHRIENNFFGESVTVAGLITGADLIAQLKDKTHGNELLIPTVMLRREGDMFLDNVTPSEVETTLNTKITVVENSGESLLNALLGR